MDELLRFFAFRTAIPCGYLIFFLAAALACAAALGLLVIGVFKKRWKLVTASAIFLGLAAVWVVGNIAFETALELNPIIQQADLIGVWQSDGSRLQVNSNGTFLFSTTDEHSEFGIPPTAGTWKFQPISTIEITDARGRRLPDLLVISFRGRLHIIRAFEDPDMWDGSLGLAKRPAA